jgi:hypothetical protein
MRERIELAVLRANGEGVLVEAVLRRTVQSGDLRSAMPDDMAVDGFGAAQGVAQATAARADEALRHRQRRVVQRRRQAGEDVAPIARGGQPRRQGQAHTVGRHAVVQHAQGFPRGQIAHLEGVLAFLRLDPQEPELGTAQRFGRDSLVAAGLRTIPQEPVDSGGAARGRREQRQVGGQADRIGHDEQAARVVLRQAAARQPLPRGLLDAAARDELQRLQRQFRDQAAHAAGIAAFAGCGIGCCLALRTSPHAPCPL